ELAPEVVAPGGDQERLAEAQRGDLVAVGLPAGAVYLGGDDADGREGGAARRRGMGRWAVRRGFVAGAGLPGPWLVFAFLRLGVFPLLRLSPRPLPELALPEEPRD